MAVDAAFPNVEIPSLYDESRIRLHSIVSRWVQGLPCHGQEFHHTAEYHRTNDGEAQRQRAQIGSDVRSLFGRFAWHGCSLRGLIKIDGGQHHAYELQG